jgi:hypothetical protein
MMLDVCCGSLKMYKGMVEPLIESDEFLTIDKRQGDFGYPKTENGWADKVILVKPKVLADMRFLPFKDGSMDGIFCDPPHLKCGEKSFMCKYYGSWSQEETIFTLRFADLEFARVLRDGGFLFLKIMKDREDIYKGMLKHFYFACPIQIERTRGTYKSKKENIDGAVWWICQKLKVPNQTKSSAQLRFELPVEVPN